jgi:hypothetical protein
MELDESGIGPENVKNSSASRPARHGSHELGPMREPVAGHAEGEGRATRGARGASLSGAVGLIEVVVRNGGSVVSKAGVWSRSRKGSASYAGSSGGGERAGVSGGATSACATRATFMRPPCSRSRSPAMSCMKRS